MNFFPIREQTWRFLRAFFMTSTVHHITAGTLAKLILSSLKLFPLPSRHSSRAWRRSRPSTGRAA